MHSENDMMGSCRVKIIWNYNYNYNLNSFNAYFLTTEMTCHTENEKERDGNSDMSGWKLGC